ncbi:MAG: hypothetical protein R2762_15095 [Bryobacteraceae bacterium]
MAGSAVIAPVVPAAAMVLLALWAQQPSREDVRPETLAAFQRHVRARESAIERERVQGRNFLWVDESDQRRKRVRSGGVVVEPLQGRGLIDVKGGLVHDWIGATFIEGTSLSKAIATVQDYNRHQQYFKPEVVESKLLWRKENEFGIFLRLVKKKVLTVTLDTEHRVRYFPLDATKVHSRSYSTRISEVEDAGTSKEMALPPGEDHGFLWRLNSYWRFQERDGGVYVECEAISLTRGIPTGFGWLVSPIVRDLPRESLESTLAGTRTMLD